MLDKLRFFFFRYVVSNFKDIGLKNLSLRNKWALHRFFLDSHCYDQQLYFYNALQNLNRFKLIVYILYESLGPSLRRRKFVSVWNSYWRYNSYRILKVNISSLIWDTLKPKVVLYFLAMVYHLVYWYMNFY